MLHNYPDTNSIVGTDIYPYSIVGAVGLPRGGKPLTCLWASIVLYVPGFTIPGKHGETPHMPLGIQQYFVGTDANPS